MLSISMLRIKRKQASGGSGSANAEKAGHSPATTARSVPVRLSHHRSQAAEKLEPGPLSRDCEELFEEQ